jgi:CDP-6-deoxy-D-xylo-4-hexulose-3-dehydrase
MSDWQSVIEAEWRKRAKLSPAKSFFPLIAQSFDEREIIAVVDTLLTGQLTMANRVRDFEKSFAEYLDVPYAVMVNSGSSANLLAVAVAVNPKRKKHFKIGDEVLVPAVCWSTSVWPLMQLGLKPVFVDADPCTLNIDLNDLKKKITPLTRGAVAVHILGNAANMSEFKIICEANNLILIEDTCESLGSKADGKYLGTQSDFGTFSFYYSHHITTGEGGMVVCHTLEDYDLLKCLRAHGWSRELSNKSELEKENSHVDPRFLFVNVGFNLRPMEIQAAFGVCQLERLKEMNKNRNSNHANLISALKNNPRWAGQLEFPVASTGVEPAWFGFPCLLPEKHGHKLRDFLNFLSERGVENRPIVSGNFTRQPALKLFDINCDPNDFTGAEAINNRGFFIGLHTEALSPNMIEKLSEILLSYEF